MYIPAVGIFTPHLEVRLNIYNLQSVKGSHVELPYRPVILGRISRSHDNPAFGNGMPSEHLVLKELKHRRTECLRHTVYLIEEKYPLLDAALFNGLIYRCYDLTHRVFGDRVFLSSESLLRDIGKSERRLPCMMSHRI